MNFGHTTGTIPTNISKLQVTLVAGTAPALTTMRKIVMQKSPPLQDGGCHHYGYVTNETSLNTSHGRLLYPG